MYICFDVFSQAICMHNITAIRSKKIRVSFQNNASGMQHSYSYISSSSLFLRNFQVTSSNSSLFSKTNSSGLSFVEVT